MYFSCPFDFQTQLTVTLSPAIIMSFFARYRVLTLAAVGLAMVHAGWYYIASDPVFNPDQKVLQVTPEYFKSKQPKQKKAAVEGVTKSQ